MYLIQGFAIDGAKIFLKPKNAAQEIVVVIAAFVLAAIGSALLHVFVEEPARQLGRKIVSRRKQRRDLYKAERVPSAT
jgi:peptidoglycan/LPS O-acetylase OafA/YrhL